MKKLESKFGTLFRHWIRANPPRETCHFELKQTTKNSIPFSCVEQHQLEYGEAIKDSPKGVLMRNMAGNGEPDYSYLYRDPVYIVICFPGAFYIIPLARFLAEKATSKRKSLTSDRAAVICTASQLLTNKR